MSRFCLKSAGSNPASERMGIGLARAPIPRKKLYAAVLLALAGPAYALPEGGQVVAGDASIAVNGNVMDIQQNSQRAILNFHSFDIANQQTVNFHQPGADAVALNRVMGDRLSEIHGALNANGQVYLINPNGVLFGNGAEINVGSLVVTTLDISDQDFLAGRDAFSGAASGRVENQGRINADGRVVLLAPEVVNRGEITVANGDIVLQSSRQALLHTPGSEIPILVEDADLLGQVVNEGTLTAGEVALILTSDKAKLAYDAAINNSGLIRAVRATGEGGEIHLLSGAGILNSGTVDASATAGSGGEITLTAETINQSGQITAKAAGTGDGGTITLLADNAIAMHSGSLIDASADQVGDAGDVVIIAEKSTWFTEDSNINARGGEIAGDGGFVEVSGLEFINVAGNVNTGASNGEGGLWYIDPTDITITDGAAGDFNSDFTGGNPNNWFPNSGQNASTISVTSLRNQLVNHGNVRIATNYMSPSNTGVTGNITFDAVFDFDGLGTGRSITLEADNQIIFTRYGGIWDSSGEGDGLNLNFTAANGFIIEDSNPTAPIPEDRELGGIVNSGLGTINITVLDGDALVTGLASAATGLDAIKLDVQNGAIIENGNSLWDVMLLTNGGGVTLKAQSGISGLSIRNNEGGVSLLDASTTTGNISGVRAAGHLEISRLVVGSTSSAAVSAEGQLTIGSGAQLIGNSFDFESDTHILIPNGFTTAGTLRLDAPDITNLTFARTLNFGADHLIIDTEATGGNLMINSTVNTLSVTNRSTNTIIVDDTDDLILGTIEPLVGAIMVSSGSGTDLTVGEDINLTSMNGALTLNAGRDLLVNAAILDGAAITLTAPRNVLFSADGAVDAGSGNIGITATSGNVALGALTGGAITVNAGGSITDANGSGVNLSATSAILTAGTGSIGALADGLETSVGTLTLNSANGSAFISNSQALNLTSVNVGDDLNVSLPTAGNLTLNQSTPTIGGTATFSVANGQLIVPNTGWTTTGNLTVSATRIVDSNSSATVSLTANNADLTLTGATASTLNVDFNTLALQLSGGQTVQVNDDNDLTLNNISNNGNLTVTTEDGSDLTITDTTPVSSGQLTLNVGRNLVLSTASLNVTGNLTISADDVRDSNASSNVSLGGADADITLRTAGNQDRNWDTDFDQLTLLIAGGGNFNLTNAGALQLTSVKTGIGNASFATESGNLTFVAGTIDGDAAFSATNGNVVLNNAPTVMGDLTLTTVGSGNVILPTAGISIGGTLTVDADNLLDGDANLTLTATDANITLRNAGNQARSWTTTFDQLVLDITGTGNFSLTNSGALDLVSLTTGGNTTVTTNAGDLAIGTASVGGNAGFTAAENLTLTSLTSNGNVTVTAADGDISFGTNSIAGNAVFNAAGDVILTSDNLTVGGNLTVAADNLRGSTAAADLTLSATNANIDLSAAGNQDRNWETDFAQLTLAIAGTGDFNLTNAGALQLTSVDTGIGNASFATESGNLTFVAGTIGGNAAFSATNGNVVLTSAPTVTGDLSLTTVGSGNVVVLNSVISVGGVLTVDADNLLDIDSDLTLTATSADITLRNVGNQSHNWTTTFDQLVLDITGTGNFSLTNSGALDLVSISTGGNTNISTNAGDLAVGTASIGGDAVFSGAGDLTLGSVSAGGDAAFTSINGDISFGSGTIDGDTVFNATAGNVELTGTPTFSGDLSLFTGDVILAGNSLAVGGDLTIEADDLRGTSTDLTLSAVNADITLRDGGTRNWSTDFNQLVLDIAGTGDFSLINSKALSLTSVTTGGNASFTTTAGNLTVGTSVIDGDADFTAQNGGITLGAGTFGGDVTFNTSGGDIVLTDTPSVTGDLNLVTQGAGDVVLSGGLDVGGKLVVDANDLVTTDPSLTLTATSADITLRDTGDQARIWNTTFDELVLTIASTGDFSLTNTGALDLTAITTGGNASISANGDLTLGIANIDGNASFTADGNLAVTSLTAGGNGEFTSTNGDITFGSGSIDGNAVFTATEGNVELTGAPTFGGDLSLYTGDVILSGDSLAAGGDLTIEADNLQGSSADLSLSAVNAAITLRAGGAQPRNWTTDFAQLVLDIAGTGSLNLTNNGALTLSSASTGGNALFRTISGDLTLGSAIDVAGELALITQDSGDVIVSAAGLEHGNRLTIEADNVLASSGDIRLTATTADITLRGGDLATSWLTDFDELALQIDGDGAFSLTDENGLTLTSIRTGGNASFTTTGANLIVNADPEVNGDLTLATAGIGDVVLTSSSLVHSGNLTINADNLTGTDETLTLAATNADIRLRDSADAHAWTTSFDTLTLSIAGGGAIAVQDTDGLTLGVITTDGEASFASTNADLILTAAPSVAGGLSLIADGSGDVVLQNSQLLHSGDLTVVADNLRGNAGSEVTLAATNADITLRDGSLARTWNTDFAHLAVDIAGTGALAVINQGSLVLDSVKTGGDASFRTSNADLTLTANPDVGGALTLAAIGSGDLILANAGLTHSGDLTVVADELISNSPIRLIATNADIHLRGGSLAQAWSTDFARLNLRIDGAGDFALVDDNGLTLDSVNVGGNASFTATNANLVVESAPVIGGDLTLRTLNSGDIVIPDAGLAVSGDLTLIADRVLDGDANLDLTAAGLSVTLRDQQQAANWTTHIDRLNLDLSGGGALNLTNTGALTVDSIISDGAVDVATSGNLQIGNLSGTDMAFNGANITLLQNTYAVDELALTAADQLTLANGGVSVADMLRVTAARMNTAGGGPVVLAANSGDLTLTGNQDLSLVTRMSQLGLTYNSANALSIQNDRSLTLQRFAVPNVTNLSLSVNGTLTVPATGLAASNRLTIDAVDLLDGDRSLSLSARELAVRLNNVGGNHNWTVNADSLDALLRGKGNLTVAAANGLRLQDLNGDSNAVMIENGNFSLALSSGDLVLSDNISAADLTADGQRAGMIDLEIQEGSVTTSGPTTLSSTNTVDRDADDLYGISIRLTDTSAAARSITLGSANGSATLRAIGGDVLLDTRPLGTAEEASRTLVHTSNSSIEIFNNSNDPRTGTVLINGELVAAEPWQSVGQNRRLVIVADYAAQPAPGGVLDELDDLDGNLDIVDEVNKSGPQAAQQFEQVFGTCDELDQKNQHRCRVDAALKSFLSHWLVGGEMPPKTEIRR
ncbi:filamentous hemagglutinin N-terminal domain-containing protein [Saccharophagus sp. K07]|uniref:filamentous hemagglutinin N-terminal domain-containing protein n=1 Tax=Saccharophagus sp. K07 TaxID=2283636 RepID=UPI001652B148|nr:filamentous hemagglutinin N-terminal domain-containing protein [Saccharophagus sp. K07]MBC6906300.1 filamentous hemagglutinin N-terminal domain-containing protein [Saccharophagus sp. K07]